MVETKKTVLRQVIGVKGEGIDVHLLVALDCGMRLSMKPASS